jgi:hypothetical protein
MYWDSQKSEKKQSHNGVLQRSFSPSQLQRPSKQLVAQSFLHLMKQAMKDESQYWSSYSLKVKQTKRKRLKIYYLKNSTFDFFT